MQELAKLGAIFQGSRIGFLLIHGLCGTPTEMKALAKRLNKYGFTALCVQLAGHCSSEEDLIATSWEDWAESTLKAYDELARHTDVIFVGGLSAGAVLSLYTAHKNPDSVRGLALYSATLRYDGWTIPKASFLLPLILRIPYIGKRYRFEEEFPYGIMNDKIRNRIISHMHGGDAEAAGFAATPGYALRELWGLVAKVKKALPEITTPALLIHAKNDDIASSRNAQYIQKHLGGTSELLLLEKSYHMITVDQERKYVCDMTAKFAFDLLNENEKANLLAHAEYPLPFQQCYVDCMVSPPCTTNDQEERDNMPSNTSAHIAQ